MNLHHVADALFPFVVLFYVLDSITVVRLYQTVYFSLWGGAYRAKSKGVLLVTLTPTASLFVDSRAPVYLTADGVYAQRPEYSGQYPVFDPDRFAFFPYDVIGELVVEDGTLTLVDGFTMKLRAPVVAHVVKTRLERLCSADSADRTARVHEVWSDSWSLDRLRARLSEHGRIRKLLRGGSIGFFALLFGLLPLALYTAVGDVIPVNWILIVCAGVYAALVTNVLLNRRQLQARGSGLTSIIAAVLSPVTVAHIATHLDKERLVACDPAALSARFLKGEMLLRFFRRELGVNRAQIRMYPDHGLTSYWKARAAALGALAQEKGLSQEAIWNSVQRTDPTAKAFCIICDTEYQNASVRCNECDVELIAY